jgi:hypothetical protein
VGPLVDAISTGHFGQLRQGTRGSSGLSSRFRPVRRLLTRAYRHVLDAIQFSGVYCLHVVAGSTCVRITFARALIDRAQTAGRCGARGAGE